MKSFTDISQSKKLAEILPLESADMIYPSNFEFPFVWIEKPEKDKNTIPCWSLSALIEFLPDNIVIDERRWGLSISKNGISYLGNMTWDGQLNISVKSGNLIDACYEMIIKLNDMNMFPL